MHSTESSSDLEELVLSWKRRTEFIISPTKRIAHTCSDCQKQGTGVFEGNLRRSYWETDGERGSGAIGTVSLQHLADRDPVDDNDEWTGVDCTKNCPHNPDGLESCEEDKEGLWLFGRAESVLAHC